MRGNLFLFEYESASLYVEHSLKVEINKSVRLLEFFVEALRFFFFGLLPGNVFILDPSTQAEVGEKSVTF